MTLHISEAEVRAVLTMPLAVEAVEEISRKQATGDLLALIEADYMGQQRTGAASGVASKYLARKNSRIAAIIGTGGQARTQLEAIAAVRKLESARAYGRDT